MSSGSYTIALLSHPCDALDWSLAIQAIPSIDQEFSVLQTFQAGVAIAGPALLSGIVTFEQSPVFEQGITVPSELNLGSLTVSGLSTLSGGLACGSTSSFSERSTFAKGLTISSDGILVTGPVDIGGTFHVNDDATLDSALYIAGTIIGYAGINVSGLVDVTGGIHSTEYVVLDDTLSVAGLVSANAGLSVAGPIILPESQVALSPAGVVLVDLAGASSGFFTLAMTSKITGFFFSGMRVNASFSIFLTVGASAKIMSKALSTPGCNCYNDLAGNT